MALVGLATCRELPVDSNDNELLTTALAARGIDTAEPIWNDDKVDWSRFDLVVIRTTWDYTHHLADFLAWVHSLTSVANPASVVAWNTDKHYLANLAERGVGVVPTTFVNSLAEFEVPEAERFVVKPTVGAGSMGAERFESTQITEAKRHAESLFSQGRDVMIQPYLERVDSVGETGIIVLDGVISHAIEKGPMLSVSELDRTGLFRQESIQPRAASQLECDVALAALRAACEITGLSEPLLYARVDLLPSEEGPVVIELELTEPSLFLSFSPQSADLFAEAIARRVE